MKPELNKETREFICGRAQAGEASGSHSRPRPRTITFLCSRSRRLRERKEEGRSHMAQEPVPVTSACPLDSQPQATTCTLSMQMVLPRAPWVHSLGSEEKDPIVRLGEDNILCWESLLSKGFSLKFSTITERIGQEAYKNEQFPNQSVLA